MTLASAINEAVEYNEIKETRDTGRAYDKYGYKVSDTGRISDNSSIEALYYNDKYR